MCCKTYLLCGKILLNDIYCRYVQPKERSKYNCRLQQISSSLLWRLWEKSTESGKRKKVVKALVLSTLTVGNSRESTFLPSLLNSFFNSILSPYLFLVLQRASYFQVFCERYVNCFIKRLLWHNLFKIFPFVFCKLLFQTLMKAFILNEVKKFILS